MSERVDIFVGGVQKAGTTSFYSYLAEHPQLCPPSRKETHYFDDETIDWRNPDYCRFHEFFPASDDSRRRFDATPIYLFWPPSLDRIRTYNPNAKLIFIFRDPIERAWSQWCMEYARKAEDMPFAEAIRDGRKRLGHLPPTADPWRVYSYVERGFYGVQVARLLELFPRENILFLKSDDLSLRPEPTLQRVWPFLDLPFFPISMHKTEHQRQGINYPSFLTGADISYLRELFHDDVLQFADLTGLDVGNWPTINPAPLRRWDRLQL